MSMNERYTIELEAVAGWRVPGIVRLRKALKLLLRSFGLRCVRCEPVDGHIPAASA